MKYKYYMDFMELQNIDKIDEATLKKKYHKLSLKYHPDKGGSSVDFQMLQESYENLSAYIRVRDELNSEKDEDLLTQMMKNINKGCKNEGFMDEIKSQINKNVDYLKNKFTTLVDPEIIRTMIYIIKDKNIFSNEELDILLKSCRQESIKKENIKILYPTLEDLYESNVFKLNYQENNYYIPLWHHELIYDSCEGDLIIQIIPDLEKHIWLDDHNNVHHYASLRVVENNLIQESLFINHYNKTYTLSNLKLKKMQTIKFSNEGIPKVNHKNMYDNSVRSDLFFHVNLYI